MADETEQTAKPETRFKIQKLADIDEMKEYRDTAALMEIDTLVDGLQNGDASKLARAITDAYGERTVRVETTKDGFKRVIRVEQRGLKPRKAKAVKVTAPAKKKADKPL